LQSLATVTHDSSRTRVRRGFAILASLLLAAALVFNLDVVVDWFHGYVDVVALVPSTSGVRIGAPVWVAGVEAGRVTAVDFQDVGGTAVIALHVRLEDRVRDVVRQSSRAHTARDRFIGAPLVRISAGSADSPPIQTGDTLQPMSTVSLDTLIQRGLAFPGALDSLTSTLSELERLAADRKADVKTLLDRWTAASREAATLTAALEGGTLGHWMRDPEPGRRVARLRERLTALGAAADAMLGRYQDPELRAGVASVAERAQRLSQALDGLERMLVEGRGFIPRAARDSALAVAVAGVQAQIDSLRAAGLGFAARMVLP